MTLKAGQTKLFGTPRVSPDWTWAQENEGGADGVHLFDWRTGSSSKTRDFNLAPKLATDSTSSLGFSIDWLQPNTRTEAGNARADGGVIGVNLPERMAVR